MAYAASRIKMSSGSEGGQPKYKEIGESVSAKDLGVTDDEFDELKTNGAVVDKKLPDDLQDNESLNAYKQRKLREGIILADAQGTVAELTAADVKPATDLTQDRVTHTDRKG